jgi:hypothetical protein
MIFFSTSDSFFISIILFFIIVFVFSEASMTVFNGALIVRTGSTVGSYTSIRYSSDYYAASFSTSKFYYGILGPFAYGTVFFFFSTIFLNLISTCGRCFRFCGDIYQCVGFDSY